VQHQATLCLRLFSPSRDFNPRSSRFRCSDERHYPIGLGLFLAEINSPARSGSERTTPRKGTDSSLAMLSNLYGRKSVELLGSKMW
jgi:hypothetical protein